MIRQFLATTVENLRSFFTSLSRGSDPHSPTDSSPYSRTSFPEQRYLDAPYYGDDAAADDDPAVEPHPEARRRGVKRRRSVQAPPSGFGPVMPPDSETQRRRMRVAGLLPPPRQESAQVEPIDTEPAQPETPPATPVADATHDDPVEFPLPPSNLPPSSPPQAEIGEVAPPSVDEQPAPTPEAPPRDTETARAAETAHAPDSIAHEIAHEEPEPEPSWPRGTLGPRRNPHLFPTQSVPAAPAIPKDEPVNDDDFDDEPDENPYIEDERIEDESIKDENIEDGPMDDARELAEQDEATEDGDAAEPPSPPAINGASPQTFGEIHAVLESLLFVSGDPVGVLQLARVLEMDADAVVEALTELGHAYARQNRGLRLQCHRDKYQIVTAPAAAVHIERLLNLDTGTKLSGPALETLAVVAYRQPVTRSQIEAVRGVDCAAVLRSLAQRGLIEEVGRLDVAGRPILYGVTDFFLQHFGITDLGELPPLEQTEADTLWAATALAEMEGENGTAQAGETQDPPDVSGPPAPTPPP